MNIDLKDFRSWLILRGYADTTTKQAVSDAGTIANSVDLGRAIPKRLLPTIKRLEAWGKAGDIITEAKTLVVEETTIRGQRKKKREARSIDDDAWTKLVDAIEREDSPAARVAEVMTATGLRVGDVLRIDRDTLLTGVPRGEMHVRLKGNRYDLIHTAGTPEAWEKLRAALAMTQCVNVASYVSSGAGSTSAYMNVRRCVQRLAKEVGITEAVWTHRIRRTVGVMAYRHSKDILAVRDLLHHTSSKTTELYLSEARADRVVDLQKAVREKFRGK